MSATDESRSLALLVSDVLTFTRDLSARQRRALAGILREYATGRLTEADVFGRMLGAGLAVTASYDRRAFASPAEHEQGHR